MDLSIPSNDGFTHPGLEPACPEVVGDLEKIFADVEKENGG